MLGRTALALTVTAVRLPREIVRFHAHVDATLGAGAELGRLSLVELVREYRRLERALLDRWDVPIANDFFVMLSFGVLKRAAAAWCGDASLAPALVSAGGGMTSAEPARAVRELAELDAAGDRLDFDLEFRAYLARFGDRCESELKLESPTLHDDARPLLAAIARLRNAPPGDAHAATALRRDAERRAHDALRGHPLRAFAFARLTAWARARLVARENLRFERTRVFGRVRRIVVAMGGALAKRGALDNARDVFHLTIDELLGYVEGTSASRDLRGLAAVRARRERAVRRRTSRRPTASRRAACPSHRSRHRPRATATTPCAPARRAARASCALACGSCTIRAARCAAARSSSPNAPTRAGSCCSPRRRRSSSSAEASSRTPRSCRARWASRRSSRCAA